MLLYPTLPQAAKKRTRSASPAPSASSRKVESQAWSCCMAVMGVAGGKGRAVRVGRSGVRNIDGSTSPASQKWARARA